MRRRLSAPGWLVLMSSAAGVEGSAESVIYATLKPRRAAWPERVVQAGIVFAAVLAHRRRLTAGRGHGTRRNRVDPDPGLRVLAGGPAVMLTTAALLPE